LALGVRNNDNLTLLGEGFSLRRVKSKRPACGMSGDMLLTRRKQSLRRAGAGQYHAVLKGRNFHNRRSMTCGYENNVLSGQRNIN
jgi:hypothetical protein